MAVDADAAGLDLSSTDPAGMPSGHTERARDSAQDDENVADGGAVRPRHSPTRTAVALGAITVLALGGLVGWLGYGAYTAHQASHRHNLYLQVARQGAINLTTISYADADADVARILDSATGSFRADFQQRAQPFIDVVKQAQSTSVGSVTAAGVESETRNGAQVLVAVTVKTSTAEGPQHDPRSWRMRIGIARDGESVKISNVEFVP